MRSNFGGYRGSHGVSGVFGAAEVPLGLPFIAGQVVQRPGGMGGPMVVLAASQGGKVLVKVRGGRPQWLHADELVAAPSH